MIAFYQSCLCLAIIGIDRPAHRHGRTRAESPAGLRLLCQFPSNPHHGKEKLHVALSQQCCHSSEPPSEDSCWLKSVSLLVNIHIPILGGACVNEPQERNHCCTVTRLLLCNNHFDCH